MIVADASLIGHAVIPNQQAALANACRHRDSTWIAPAMWRYELVGLLAKYLREPDTTKRLTLRDAILARTWALTLVATSDFEPAEDDVLRAAADLKISGYDAHYVVLAEHLGVRVVTADHQLLTRAAHVCVSLADFAAGR